LSAPSWPKIGTLDANRSKWATLVHQAGTGRGCAAPGLGFLRIEIASSAYPLYDRNPGTEIAPRLADSWNWQRSTQTIFHEPSRPSAIRFPVIEQQQPAEEKA